MTLSAERAHGEIGWAGHEWVRSIRGIDRAMQEKVNLRRPKWQGGMPSRIIICRFSGDSPGTRRAQREDGAAGQQRQVMALAVQLGVP